MTALCTIIDVTRDLPLPGQFARLRAKRAPLYITFRRQGRFHRGSAVNHLYARFCSLPSL